MLQTLTYSVQALETSQMQIDENERFRGFIDSGLYASELGRGMGGTPMHRNAIGYDAPRPAHGRMRVPQPRGSLF